MLHDPTHLKFKTIETESTMMVGEGWEEGDMGSCCSLGVISVT